MNPYKGVSGSCKTQMLLNLAGNMVSPELDVAVTASGILVGNSLLHNPKRSAIQEEALEGIYNGTKIGGIGITEMEHGSDAVNMKTRASIAENGDITYNGIKIYTTNGPVADKACLPGPPSPNVAQVLVLVTHEHVGNELLVGGIFFHLRARHETGDALNKELAEIISHVKCESLKHPYLFKDFSFDNQYLFFPGHAVTPFICVKSY